MKTRQRFDKTNPNSLAAMDAFEASTDKVPEDDGGREAVMLKPFTTATSMRATSMSRKFHGADFLLDCEIVADKLALARQGEEARDSGNHSLQLPPFDYITFFSSDTVPRLPPDDRSWQGVHDEVFSIMYSLEAREARYIRKPPCDQDLMLCLVLGSTDKNRKDPWRIQAREELMSHVYFINKYWNVVEFTNHMYQIATGHKETWNGAQHEWKSGWWTIRNEITAQIFGSSVNNI
ncbi:hypothetical protein QBC41DRAFT_128557 [Cercophora samala]|uniref:Uncharacterized protein n=1 Tax=Cercophora samala TaxID=330535 RepID=A0AA39ZCP9_9PEZI|nr:hypothetical protein QBC41DRAFT_128557 [Cercophora samala]